MQQIFAGIPGLKVVIPGNPQDAYSLLRASILSSDPIIFLDLVKTRPIKVVVSGEVNRPGIYSIDVKGENQLVNNDGGEQTSIKTYGWPTLVDAIQKAGGITNKGDLRNVNLIREMLIYTNFQ